MMSKWGSEAEKKRKAVNIKNHYDLTSIHQHYLNCMSIFSRQSRRNQSKTTCIWWKKRKIGFQLLSNQCSVEQMVTDGFKGQWFRIVSQQKVKMWREGSVPTDNHGNGHQMSNKWCLSWWITEVWESVQSQTSSRSMWFFLHFQCPDVYHILWLMSQKMKYLLYPKC